MGSVSFSGRRWQSSIGFQPFEILWLRVATALTGAFARSGIGVTASGGARARVRRTKAVITICEAAIEEPTGLVRPSWRPSAGGARDCCEGPLFGRHLRSTCQRPSLQ